MVNDWHDAELSLRLAVNIMGWVKGCKGPTGNYHEDHYTDPDGIIHDITTWDPCCEYRDSGALEQRLEFLGWSVLMDSCMGDDLVREYEAEVSGKIGGLCMRGVTRLHALALSAEVPYRG